MKVAIITARGGSKRIPRKNIREFCGKPILAYSIEAALQSEVFDEVMISTEDDEIAEIAQSYGAKFPFRRSEEMSSDHAMTIDVILEVAKEYKRIGKDFDTFCCIYPTAPFVTAEKLNSSYEILEKNRAEAVIPVVKFSFPPQRCFVIENELMQYKWKEFEFSRSQDLEPFYHDAGQFYYIRAHALFEQRTLVPKKTAPYILDEMEVQDIDNIDDWKIAELKYLAMKKEIR